MICSKDDTDEGREQEKVNTEKRKNPGVGLYLLPLVMALPFLAAIAFAALRFGPTIMQLLNAAVKAAVVQ